MYYCYYKLSFLEKLSSSWRVLYRTFHCILYKYDFKPFLKQRFIRNSVSQHRQRVQLSQPLQPYIQAIPSSFPFSLNHAHILFLCVYAQKFATQNHNLKTKYSGMKESLAVVRDEVDNLQLKLNNKSSQPETTIVLDQYGQLAIARLCVFTVLYMSVKCINLWVHDRI